MKKPYIVCHMMTSLDGRIDCAMTEQIPGSEEYYTTLAALNADSYLSGKVTASLHYAAGLYTSKDTAPYGKTGWSQKVVAESYNFVVDTKGTLLWETNTIDDCPLVVITSTQVSKEYLADLDQKGISWIACGDESIDLAQAMAILVEKFKVGRLAVVGGGNINAGFLKEGLLDEISILIGPGIDGRKGMTAVFDGLASETKPVTLRLTGVQSFEDGAVWLRYNF